MALLPSFGAIADREADILWREGLFVLDTSMLLNLHRYRDGVRDDFLKALNNLKNQIWIPFHVAIEYELNRPKVIAEKRMAIEKTRSKVASFAEEMRGRLGEIGAFRRHSHIDANALIEKIKEASDEFCESLEKLALKTPSVTEDDVVRKKIAELFAGRVGQAPDSMDEVSGWDRAAAGRYAVGAPPGYLDQAKDESRELGAFSFGGLTYQKKYGDLYIWEQIKKKVNGSCKAVCFVTDDQKEDWWWTIDSEGKKRLGPRPELREEMQRECAVGIFHMYSPDAFVEAYSRYRRAPLEPDTISEAREISLERRVLRSGAGPFGQRARRGVARWVRVTIGGRVYEAGDFPDFVELDNDDMILRGFEVVPVIAPVLEVAQRIERRRSDIDTFLSENPAATIRLMFVFKDAASARSQIYQFRAHKDLPPRTTMCVGYMDGGSYRHLKCFLNVDVSEGLAVDA